MSNLFTAVSVEQQEIVAGGYGLLDSLSQYSSDTGVTAGTFANGKETGTFLSFFQKIQSASYLRAFFV